VHPQNTKKLCNNRKMHDQNEVLTMNSFADVVKLKTPSIGQNIVILDIRNVISAEDRRRILDILTGLALGKKCKIRQINKNGEFLIIPPTD
tara:strand:+ start:1440 stop:1712 length:273 start_codon:yes stop_codon:yes gene_type:complete